MARIDFDSLSLAELKSLGKDITKANADFYGRKKSEALLALETHAKEMGFSLAELTGAKKVRKGVVRGNWLEGARAPG